MIYENVVASCKKRGISIAVRALGVSDAAVYMWETGKMTPTAKRLVAVAQLYGCTVDDLLKEDE